MGRDTKPLTYSTELFKGKHVRFGHFQLHTDHPDFATAGRINKPTIVFPRTPTFIQQAHRPKFLSEPNFVNIYDGTREYHREVFDLRGDVCDWFEFSPEIFAQALASHVDTFKWDDIEIDIDHLRCAPQTYWQQRSLINHMFNHSAVDGAVEESAFALLAEVMSFGLGCYPDSVKKPKTRMLYQEICDRVQQLLLDNVSDLVSLEDIADNLGISLFHMCRVFKQTMGVTIHQYRMHLRLKYSLDALLIESDITKVALDLGFASHSHFTTTFHHCFGQTPREYRASAARLHFT